MDTIPNISFKSTNNAIDVEVLSLFECRLVQMTTLG